MHIQRLTLVCFICFAFIAGVARSSDARRSPKIVDKSRLTIATINTFDDKFCSAKLDGDYPNPANPCGREFFKCSNGETSIFECQPGLAFNPAIDECDYKINVPGCGGEELTTTDAPQPSESSAPPTMSDEPERTTTDVQQTTESSAPPTTSKEPEMTTTDVPQPPETSALPTTGKEPETTASTVKITSATTSTTPMKTSRRTTRVSTKPPFEGKFLYPCRSNQQCADTIYGSCHDTADPNGSFCDCVFMGPSGSCRINKDCCDNACVGGQCKIGGGTAGTICAPRADCATLNMCCARGCTCKPYENFGYCTCP